MDERLDAAARESSPETIDRIAAFLVGRGLAVPSIFLLELQKPLCGLAGAAGTAAQPLLSAVLGPRLGEHLVDIAGSRAQIEALISAIEKREANRRESRA